MLARLPVPGSDAGTWGEVLNDFMSVAHNPDGSLKTSAVSSSTPTATTTTPGLVQLTGDLAGSSTNPQIATGAIVDTDINASANISQSKIANLTADLASKYILPSGGIPESDLSAGVQAALSAGSSGNATSLQGRSVGSVVPNDGQALVWNEDSSAWEPQAPAINSVTFPSFDYLSPAIAANTNFTVSTPWASASGTVLIRQIRIQVTDPTAVFDLKILRQNDFSAGGQNANLAFWVQSVKGSWMREIIWDYEDEDNTSQVHVWLANKSAVPSTVRILFNKRVAQ